MAQESSNSNWWIWKVFWILLVVTGVEVILGIIKPPFLVETIFLGTKLLNHIFIILTLVKAAYIVMVLHAFRTRSKGIEMGHHCTNVYSNSLLTFYTTC